jgi:small GTP-binding protein
MTIQSNKSNREKKLEKNILENEKKKDDENKNIENKKINDKNINEEKKDNSSYIQYKNISSNSQINAGKETNRNSHISDNKKQNNNISNKEIKMIKKDKILEKKKNKKEINFVILGEKNIGKSCFVIKFVENIFEKIYVPTIGLELKKKIVSYNTHQYQLNFIVTSGNDYKEDYINYYNEADFFLVFYDITNKNSFDKIKDIFHNEIHKYFFQYNDGTPNIILLGNKIDLENERVVLNEDVDKFCKENQLIHYDISVKSNKNINLLMNIILKAFDQVSYVG